MGRALGSFGRSLILDEAEDAKVFRIVQDGPNNACRDEHFGGSQSFLAAILRVHAVKTYALGTGYFHRETYLLNGGLMTVM